MDSADIECEKVRCYLKVKPSLRVSDDDDDNNNNNNNTNIIIIIITTTSKAP